jgi:hypothetical protein
VHLTPQLKGRKNRDLNHSMETLKEQNILVCITSAEDLASVEILKRELISTQDLNISRKANVQSVKAEIETELSLFQEQLACLQKEVSHFLVNFAIKLF